MAERNNFYDLRNALNPIDRNKLLSDYFNSPEYATLANASKENVLAQSEGNLGGSTTRNQLARIAPTLGLTYLNQASNERQNQIQNLANLAALQQADIDSAQNQMQRDIVNQLERDKFGEIKNLNRINSALDINYFLNKQRNDDFGRRYNVADLRRKTRNDDFGRRYNLADLRRKTRNDDFSRRYNLADLSETRLNNQYVRDKETKAAKEKAFNMEFNRQMALAGLQRNLLNDAFTNNYNVASLGQNSAANLGSYGQNFANTAGNNFNAIGQAQAYGATAPFQALMSGLTAAAKAGAF